MPSVLAVKPGHDGAFAFVADGDLIYSFEGEKDTFERNGPVTAQLMLEAMRSAPTFPDVLAIGGWFKTLPGVVGAVEAGYHGLEPGEPGEAEIFGRKVTLYSSSHERSHLYGGVAMSPFDPGQEIAVLVWEGQIGAFYRWRGPRAPIERFEVLDQPGARYAALFCLADPQFPDSGSWPSLAAAGKLMALAGLADDAPPAADSVQVVESLLRAPWLYPLDKKGLAHSDLHNCGTPHPELCRAARYLSDRLFEIYETRARALFPSPLPLVITGGCGLNCDWNRAWRDCGLFTDVFVPPCANDSGSALGTAMDALVQTGHDCNLTWDVYRGAPFVPDVDPVSFGWKRGPLVYDWLSRALDEGAVVAWVQGRCEIGPRALGNRSLLASAADRASHDRLNRIKQREDYRPIAPVCREEELGLWFQPSFPDPYMLHFRKVRTPDRLPAVTHADGSARVQSVTAASHSSLHALLTSHRSRTGVGVLCNTSLNYPGSGFINRTSELLHYCRLKGIRHIVLDDIWYSRETN